MPLPKRPFTTTSLTSTLKSTIASQPLLSNLNNNIDKLSSQATSFAQKTPFFGAINPQQQQQQHDAPTSSQANTDSRAPTSDPSMMRNTMGGPNQGCAQQAPKPVPRQPMDTSPAVDMSHLTEEERLMIQSVMAKAEMADRGMSVDTSAPSSTNLPSNASNALMQQQQQARNNQQHRQLQQPQTSGNQQQTQFQLQQQPQPIMNQNISNNQQQQQRDFIQQQAAQMNMMHGNNTALTNDDFQQMNVNQARDGHLQQMNAAQQQQQPFQQSLQTQPIQLNQQQLASCQNPGNNNNINQQTNVDSRINPSIPSLEQQTQQLISQINSQFNLGGQKQQEQQQQAHRNVPEIHQNAPNQFALNHFQPTNNNQMRMQPSNMNSFDQSQPGQQVAANPISPGMQVQAADNSQNYLNDQMQSQQQQAQLNRMRMCQLDYGLSNQGVANSSGQMMNPNVTTQQQQQYLNKSSNANELPINQALPPQRTNAQAPNMMRVTSQMNSIDATSMPSYTAHQQSHPTMQNINPIDQRISVPDFSTMNMNQFMARGPDTQAQTGGYNESAVPHQAYAQAPYQDPRNSIRFGQEQSSLEADYNDQTLSDQEYHGGRSRRHHQSSRGPSRYDSVEGNDLRRRDQVNAKERNILAYDLAQGAQPQRSLGSKQGARQLPQVQQQVDQHTSPHDPSERHHHNSRSKKAKRSYGRSSSNRENAQDSPEYLSEKSDLLDSPNEESKKQVKEVSKKSPSVSDKDTLDKNEEAIRLLSELKLTEQANQMMEQQQLLIKQSQELIKLQLEQQALSQELKKSIKQGSTGTSNLEQKNDRRDEDSSREKDPNSQDIRQQEDESRIEVSRQKLAGGKNDDRLGARDTEADSSRKTKISLGRDFDSDIEDSPRCAAKSASKFDNLNDDSHAFDERTSKQSSEKGREKVLANERKSNLANSSVQTCPSPRYNRDLLQSPTDTTDSDVEPISQSNLRKNQQRLNQSMTKPKNVVRRREPTGLPPSPLPVAAAIQLHQMQQQHFRNQITSGTSGLRSNVSRNNFLRSRSVTNSPNHLLERSSYGGYLTDSHQRVRSTSPDTLSEFGGQRRRKRLPEPPSNAVPITPSMVRKMIQAQRAGAAAGKMLTSVNAQSTLLNNTHTNRSLAFERGPVNHDNPTSSRTSTLINESQPNMIGSYSQNLKTTQIGMTPVINSSPTNAAQIKSTGTSDLNKFLSSTYGNSILKNNITDVKETPELDKLIGNLDEFYNIDNKTRHVRLAQPSGTQLNDSYIQSSLAGPSNVPPNMIPTGRSLGVLTHPSNTLVSVLDPNTRSYSGSGTPSYLTRRSSEGENNLSRINARRPYRQTNLDECYRNYGRNFTASSYIDGRESSFLNSSPIRSSRYTNPLGTSERLRDYSSGHNDTWIPEMGGANRYDRSSTANQDHSSGHGSITYPRLNATGSFDCDYMDHLDDHKTYPQMSTSVMQAPSSNRYQSAYTNASNLDSIRDRYRSSLNERSEFVKSSPKYHGLVR